MIANNTNRKFNEEFIECLILNNDYDEGDQFLLVLWNDSLNTRREETNNNVTCTKTNLLLITAIKHELF